MPLILGAQSAVSTGYSMDNSCRFNYPDDDEFTKTLGTPTDNDKWTLSVWIKRGELGVLRCIVDAASSGTTYTEICFHVNNTLFWDEYHSGVLVGRLTTNRVFSDPSAWYHIMFVYDSGNASATDRMRIYVNGTEETSFSIDTNPTQDLSSVFNSAVAHSIGSITPEGGTSGFWDGYMADVVLCDGQAYAASDFGEFNEDSPTIWQPTSPSGLTFGDNGFWLDFKDSAALGDDVSGNSNDFTVVNIAAVDQCQDSPTNNFATWNPLNNYYPAVTLSNGNTTLVTASAVYAPSLSTLGMSAGKWYVEVKPTGRVADKNNIIGVVSTQATAAAQELGNFANDWGYEAKPGTGTGDLRNNNSSSTYGNTYDDDDIIGIALDVDNLKLYFAKNGTWQNSGVPTSGATGTGAVSITTGALGNWFFGCTYWTSGGCTFNANFGNPPYVNTSDAADENGYGKFEYAPPSGYLALCTKNLGSDGG